ncbi:phosphotransferase [Streptomyces sp. NPDC005438]|uniref:phosphotransferase n=1 Tax=Streptomyces sp. NPDC005438 TaxID=3156880 RepID=UPI0033A03662
MTQRTVRALLDLLTSYSPPAAPEPDEGAREPGVLADRPDGTVVRLGDTVAKAHPPDSDPDPLAFRLRLAADQPRLLLAPLRPGAGPGLTVPLADRPASLWPYGVPVDPEHPEHAPWERAGQLLARLHRLDPSSVTARLGPAPYSRGPAKVARAVRRMRRWAARFPEEARTVERAYDGLPPWCRDEAAPPGELALCHGDFHLGQLVRPPHRGGDWLLIDVDDLGLAPACWDLARPAAFFACGLLPPEVWQRFLHAYQTERGPDLGPHPWPWAELDAPARALTVQSGASALARAGEEDRSVDVDERALLAACARMSQLPAPARE